MRIVQRAAAVVLCLAVLASLAGCSTGLPDLSVPAASDETASAAVSVSGSASVSASVSASGSASVQKSTQTLAGGGYFTDAPERSDVAYADMDPKAPTLEEFEALTEAVAAFADRGGSSEDFAAACKAAQDALSRMETASTLLGLKNSATPADTELAAETTDSENDYYAAGDDYWAAVHRVAVSGHADLLKSVFEDWQIDQYKGYDDSGSEDSLELGKQETELVRQYEALISADPVDYDAVCELYVRMVGVRNKIAAQAGYDSYADYAYNYIYSRSYTPEDAQTIWTAAQENFRPLVEQYASGISEKTQKLYYSGEIDSSEEKILDAIQTGADGMSPETAAAARYLRQYGLCDIAPSDEKLSTGYTTYLSWYNEPFIFNCPYGSYVDYTDMFHEFGHYLAYFYNGSDTLYGVSDYDLSELQSQGMEVMFFPFYEQVFGGNDAKTIRAGTLLNLIYSVVDGAMYDEFQSRVYSEKNLTSARVQDIFAEVYQKYGYQEYDGFQQEWMDQIHNFEQPMYYISYAASAIPALELFAKQQEDAAGAMDTYLQVASMSNEDYYLSDALKQAGLSDVFAAGTGAKIAGALRDSGALGIS